MSFNKEAIEHIQSSANIPALLNQISSHKTQVPLSLTPESMRINSLENYMEYAARYRLNYRTTSIKDFNEYNKLHDQDGATCFIDADSMTAKSIFDLGTVELPGHKENMARITLKQTAAFSAILCINGQKLAQKHAGEFIEDWFEQMEVFTSDGESITARNAAASLQNLTIEAARSVTSAIDNFGESMSSMEKIEAKNKDLLPAEIHFHCNPYNGLDERKFALRISILTGDDKPKISFRILQLESIEEKIAEEFKDVISEASEDLSLKTFIGEA